MSISARHTRPVANDQNINAEERLHKVLDKPHGADVGDVFTSLIHTCDLNQVNSFDYLTELQRHAVELRANPSEWMPWNYRHTLGRVAGI